MLASMISAGDDTSNSELIGAAHRGLTSCIEELQSTCVRPQQSSPAGVVSVQGSIQRERHVEPGPQPYYPSGDYLALINDPMRPPWSTSRGEIPNAECECVRGSGLVLGLGASGGLTSGDSRQRACVQLIDLSGRGGVLAVRDEWCMKNRLRH